MKKRLILITLCFYLLFSFGPLFAQNSIVVSGYPLLSLATYLFPKAKIYSILPPKGDFHHHELKPKDLQAIKQADLVIIVGTEPWAKRVFSLKSKKILSLARPEEKQPKDPHLWFSLDRVERLVKELSRFAEKKEAEKFLAEVHDLKKERAKLASCKNKTFFHLGHRVFYYLVEGSGVEEVPLVIGHHHGEVSPGTLMKFLKALEAKGIKRVLVSSSEFKNYENYFKDKGYEVIRAYSGDEPIRLSYQDFIKHNIFAIKKALYCEE
jgi:zinc transport system substrate-binding protein